MSNRKEILDLISKNTAIIGSYYSLAAHIRTAMTSKGHPPLLHLHAYYMDAAQTLAATNALLLGSIEGAPHDL